MENLFPLGNFYANAQQQSVQQPQMQQPVNNGGAAPKFCPNCGTPTNGAKFCSNCGQKLV